MDFEVLLGDYNSLVWCEWRRNVLPSEFLRRKVTFHLLIILSLIPTHFHNLEWCLFHKLFKLFLLLLLLLLHDRILALLFARLTLELSRCHLSGWIELLLLLGLQIHVPQLSKQETIIWYFRVFCLFEICLQLKQLLELSCSHIHVLVGIHITTALDQSLHNQQALFLVRCSY